MFSGLPVVLLCGTMWLQDTVLEIRGVLGEIGHVPHNNDRPYKSMVRSQHIPLIPICSLLPNNLPIVNDPADNPHHRQQHRLYKIPTNPIIHPIIAYNEEDRYNINPRSSNIQF